VLGVSPLALPDVNPILSVPGGLALLAYLHLAMRRAYPERAAVRVARFVLAAVLLTGALGLTFLGAVLHTTLMLG
jgi:hypothetical protein